MNIALFGGSFDPPTLGHLMVVAHLSLNDPDIDQVWVLPCFLQTGKNLIDFKHRFTMSQLTFGLLNRVTVSDIEEQLGGESLTYRCVEALHALHPQHSFRFVVGSDLRDKIKTWQRGDIIEQLAPPITVGRAGIPGSDNPTPISPVISSTIVRQALVEERYGDAERYLTAGTLEYIRARNLYSR